MKIITQNKKAYFDYEILDTYEAGLVLTGDEVKSVRQGHVSLVGSFATIKGDELWLINCSISAYAQAYQKKEDTATRSRKLLLHRRELNKILGDVSKKGVTILPLRLYLNERNFIKVQLGLGKHKKAAGKKEAIKERDIARQTRRELKGE